MRDERGEIREERGEGREERGGGDGRQAEKRGAPNWRREV